MQLSLLTSKKIRKMSFGEVTSPVQFVNVTPHESGLFCQRIFGPVRSFVCACGSLEGEAYAGQTCSSCYVVCCNNSVRSTRFGHIELPYPVVHPLFFNTLSDILGITKKLLTKISLGETRFIIEAGPIPSSLIEPFQIIESDSEESRSGTYAMYRVVSLIGDMENSECSETQIAAYKKLSGSGLQIKDLFLDAIPVLPPTLRPALETLEGKLIIHSLNSIYTKLIEQANRARCIIDNDKIQMPQVLEELSARSFQKTVNGLFLDGTRTPAGEAVPSIYTMLKGKTGFIRGNIMGKRVDYSARCVITSGPEQPLDTVTVPEFVAYELLKPFIIRDLLENRVVDSYGAARDMYRAKDPEALQTLEYILPQHYVLLNRQPSLHRNSIMAFKLRVHKLHCLLFPPMVTSPFNADFDGDTMAIYLPLSNAAYAETDNLLAVKENQHTIRTGSPSFLPSHEMVIGIDYMCRHVDSKLTVIENDIDKLVLLEYHKVIKVNTLITFGNSGSRIQTTLGRLLLEKALGIPFPEHIDKGIIRSLVTKMYATYGDADGLLRLKAVQDLSFSYATSSGFSFSLSDVTEPAEKPRIVAAAEREQYVLDDKFSKNRIERDEHYEGVIRLWQKALEDLFTAYITETPLGNPLHAMYRTGARVSKSQVAQLATAKGMFTKADNTIMEIPIKNTLRNGLTVEDYFKSCSGSRKSMADKVFITPQTGYFARKLTSAARDLYVVDDDCLTEHGISIKESEAAGRAILRVDSCIPGNVIVRSPITCEGHRGICIACYGNAVHTGNPVRFGEAVGAVAASCLSEPATQLSMRTFHTSGSVSLAESNLVVKTNVSGTISIIDSESGHMIQVAGSVYFMHEDTQLLVNTGDSVNIGDPLVVYVDPDLQNEDIAATLPTLEGYCELRKPKNPVALLAVKTGIVKLDFVETGISISVDNVNVGIAKNVPVFVHDGQSVRIGDQLTYGNIDIGAFFSTTENLEATSNLFMRSVDTLYTKSGIHVERIHLEVLFRAMSELVIDDSGNYGLRRYNDKGKICVKGITSVSRDYPSFLKGVTFGWIKKHIVTGVLSEGSVYDIPSERLMQGRRPEWT